MTVMLMITVGGAGHVFGPGMVPKCYERFFCYHIFNSGTVSDCFF